MIAVYFGAVIVAVMDCQDIEIADESEKHYDDDDDGDDDRTMMVHHQRYPEVDLRTVRSSNLIIVRPFFSDYNIEL